MQLGMVGLGRMGGNMARRLRRGGIDVAAYNREFTRTEQLAQDTGLIAAESIDALIEKLDAPLINNSSTLFMYLDCVSKIPLSDEFNSKPI